MLRKINPDIAKELFLCLLSAVLLTISFLNPDLWLLVWFAFVPLFFALENKPRSFLHPVDPADIKVRAKSKWRVFLLTYLTGVIFWFGTIYWLIHVTLVGLILLVLYLAVYFGIFGIIIKIYGMRNAKYDILFIPAIWVCLEYLRGHLLTGFPWAFLGYCQYRNLPVIQIADITGVYGVSFLVVMVNVFIYKVISRKLGVTGKKEKDLYAPSTTYYVLPIFFFFLSLGYGFYKINSSLITHNSSLIKVSVIQGNIPQELKWNPAAKEKIVAKYFLLTEEAAKNDPDFIIWPETAMQDYLVIEKRNYFNIEKLTSFIRQINTPFLIGMVTYQRGNDWHSFYYNSAVLFSPQGEVLNRYDKLHLVPFGEYIPQRKIFSFLETFVPIADFTAGRDYSVFSLDLNSKTYELKGSKTQFSTLICFEDIFPALSRNFVKQGAEFLINITNDAWFMDTHEPYQHLSASIFRAVENRVSVVRSANTGISCFILPSGRIKAKVSDDKEKVTFIDGHITDTILGGLGQSIYNRYGDIFVLLCFIIVSCGIIARLKTRIVK